MRLPRRHSLEFNENFVAKFNCFTREDYLNLGDIGDFISDDGEIIIEGSIWMDYSSPLKFPIQGYPLLKKLVKQGIVKEKIKDLTIKERLL